MYSPAGRTVFTLEETDAGWRYTVSRDGQPLLPPARLGLEVDGQPLQLAAVDLVDWEPVSTDFPVHGNYARATVDGHRGTYRCSTARGGVLNLEVFVADEGVGFRYRLDGEAGGGGAEPLRLTGETTTFHLPDEAVVWSAPHYEGFWTGVPTADFQDTSAVVLPLVAQHPGGYVLISESMALDYPAVSAERRDSVFGLGFQLGDNYTDGMDFGDRLLTPWRTILLADDLNALVRNPLVYALADPPAAELADADWIAPGRAGWTWVDGGFLGQNYDNMRAQITAAGELGWEYLIVDDGWEHWPNKWLRVAELTALGDSLGVGILLWKPTADYQAAWQTAKFGPQDTIRGLLDPEYRREFFDRAALAGVAGFKVDFVDEYNLERVNFIRTIVEEAAARRMVINFHGASKPSGIERTYPNLLVYESVRGLENVWKDTALYRLSTILPFTRYVIGSGDFTPVMGRYSSAGSRAHQLADAINLLAPLNSFAASPVRMLDLPERELLEDIPVVWDSVHVLPPSEIGRAAVLAKYAGGAVYVGVAAGGQSLRFGLPLDRILPTDGRYDLLWYRDGDDPAQLNPARDTVDRRASLLIRTAPNGGAVLRLRPLGE